jgi:hypothetical protein
MRLVSNKMNVCKGEGSQTCEFENFLISLCESEISWQLDDDSQLRHEEN